MTRRDRNDFIMGAACVLILFALLVLTACGGRAVAGIAVDGAAVARPQADQPKPATVADADAAIAEARDDVATLTAKLAFARALVDVKEAGRIQIAKDAERDARQAQSASQARWLTWIAGLVFVVGVAALVASFWLPIPKTWGAIAAAGGLGLLVAARLWTWAGDHALALGLGALAIGAAACLRAWWRTASAARHIAQISDRLEFAHGAARGFVKAEAAELQKKTGTTDLVRRLRGKPKPKA